MTREEARTDLMIAQADISYRPKDDSIDMAIKALEQEPKTGHWILVDEESNIWKCTNCIKEGKNDLYWWKLNHGTPQDNKMDYCPHCGAKMQQQ